MDAEDYRARTARARAEQWNPQPFWPPVEFTTRTCAGCDTMRRMPKPTSKCADCQDKG